MHSFLKIAHIRVGYLHISLDESLIVISEPKEAPTSVTLVGTGHLQIASPFLESVCIPFLNTTWPK